MDCGLCCKPVDTDEIEISSLQCCLCSTYYHGCCLDLDDDVLALLYVVKNLNGWCCEKCRRSYKNYKTFTDIPIDSSQKKSCRANDKSTVLLQEKISSLANDMVVVKSQLQYIVDDLKQLPKTPHAEVLSEEAAIMIDPASAGPSGIDTSSWKEFRGRNNRKLPVLTSNSNSKKNPSLDQDTREAMLVAMHSEMSTINRRSTAVVVSGLPVRSDVPDIDQFNNICIQHLHFNPTVKSACRLGKRIEGKMQPLLVHLSSPNEVTSLMNVAKNLRTASSDYVKTCVYINRHLTKAEATAAWKLRDARRNKRNTPANAPDSKRMTIDTISRDGPDQTDPASVSPMDPTAPAFTPGTKTGIISPVDTIQSSSGHSSSSKP